MVHKFIHLNNHTNYSLLEGMLKINMIADLCHLYKMPAVAITDTNNMFGVLDFSKTMMNSGIQPIIGTKVTIKEQQKYGHLVLLAINQAGYHDLAKISSKSYLESADCNLSCLILQQLQGLTNHIICLTGGVNGIIGNLAQNHFSHNQLEQIVEKLKQLFPNSLYIELQRHNMEWEQKLEPLFLSLAYHHKLPIVATNNCLFANHQQEEAAQVLACIKLNSFNLQDIKLNKNHYFKSQEEMIELFSDLPEAIDNTIYIAKRCSAYVQTSTPILPKFSANENKTLRAQALTGLQSRLEQIPQQEQSNIATYHQRLEYELSIIIQMNFAGYFLIVADFVKWAKDNQITVGPGRGSGAGSLVAWSLFITEINPIPFGLIFERFLNPERISIPDFDIDFCPEARDRVIRYIEKKYGIDHIAQIVTFGTLQARMVLRDVGRVIGVPYKVTDQICKMIPTVQTISTNLQDVIKQDSQISKMMQQDDQIKRLINIAQQLEGLYRHASIHAAGIIIADRPLQDLLPLYKDQDTQVIATQFNMKATEQIGLVKFDFLGLKTLTIIDKTKELANVKQNMNILPLNDAKVYQSIFCTGLTGGVFQFESQGMTKATKKIQPQNINEIIAILALYRPGPMNNIPSYIDVKFGNKKLDLLHPLIDDIIAETYGIIIYQEQVMKIAQKFAGFTLSQADILRYAMGKKIRTIMNEQKIIFLAGAKKQGISKDTAEKVFNFIDKFAEYGFNKSHSTAYAIIAYQTAWLKTYYPCEFITAFLQTELQNTDKLYIFLNEMFQLNIKLVSPDINASEENFTITQHNSIKNIQVGFLSIKGIGHDFAARITSERKQNGLYTSISDFANRIHSIKRNQILPLIMVGAFDKLYPNRGQLYHGYELIIKSKTDQNLFNFIEDQHYDLEAQLNNYPNWDLEAQVAQEIKLLGYVTTHPIQDLITQYLSNLGLSSFITIMTIKAPNTKAMLVAGIILEIKQKLSYKSKKNVYLIKLYDNKQVIEILHKNSQINYQIGQILVCSIEKTDSYITIIQSWTYDNYLASRNTLAITTDNQDNLATLQQLLINDCPNTQGNTKIQLTYKNKKFNLQHTIHLTHQIIIQLSKIKYINFQIY